METNEKKEKKKFNVYEAAGKVGGGVKKYGGYALGLIAIPALKAVWNVVKNKKM